MRRIPYILIKDNKLTYLCPKCRRPIPRDFYKLQDWCPNCEHPLNRTAKNIKKVYEMFDKEMLDVFINELRGDNDV